MGYNSDFNEFTAASRVESSWFTSGSFQVHFRFTSSSLQVHFKFTSGSLKKMAELAKNGDFSINANLNIFDVKPGL